jgi:hypothetical protein
MVEGDELTRTVTLEKPLVVGDAILVLEAVDPSARAGVPISREAYHFHFKTDAANQSTGTLVGSIGIGPLCPVENAAEPCNVSPEVYAALKVYVYKADKKTLVVTLTPDEKGKYRTDLPVGTYWVTTDERPEIGSIEGAPEEVEIRPLQTAVISIVIDTGIR